MCVIYCVCVCVCHGLSGGVSVSHNQGQVACRQFNAVGFAEHKNSTFPPPGPFPRCRHCFSSAV